MVVRFDAKLSRRVERVVERLAAGTQLHRANDVGIVTAVITVTLGLVWSTVYATNGTSNVFLHAMYVPIIVASLTLGTAGGFFTALAAATLVGPLMPLNVELGVAQPVQNTVYRAAFFVLIAVTTGAFASINRRRLDQLTTSRAHIGDLLARNLRMFARLVAERDEQTGGHCDRVANNAVRLGKALGIRGDEQRTLYWAGMLHDLGKLGVPEDVLRKPGRLTSDEFDLIKRHPAHGEELLLEISEDFKDIAVGVRSHHERWDGKGYPDGLAADAIPLTGRVLAVVDVFEAVTSVRPYRGPMSREEARRLIFDGAGCHFDPHVVEAFLRLENDGLITREVAPDPMLTDVGIARLDPDERDAGRNEFLN